MSTKDDLIKALKDYIKLLGDELSDLAPYLHIHGWKSMRIVQGEEMRARIQQLEQELDDEIHKY